MVSSKSAATKKSCPMDMSLPTPAPSVVSHNGCGQTQIALSILLVLSYMPMPVTAYKPGFISPLENITVAAGRLAQFTCVVKHLGGHKVAWLRSDSKAILAIHTHMVTNNPRMHVEHNGHNSWTLRINGVQRNDSGVYMCQINTEPMTSKIGLLSVVEAPDILYNETSNDTIVAEGAGVSLRCEARGFPEPTVTWRREDGAMIALRNELGKTVRVDSVEGPDLELSRLTRADMGAYLCIAKNGIPSPVSKRIMVLVHFHPLIKVHEHMISTKLGSTVQLSCSVEASPTSVNYWIKKGGGAREMDRNINPSRRFLPMEKKESIYTVTMILTIRDVRHTDFGNYTCVARNSKGSVKGTVALQELYVPTPAPTSPPPRRSNNEVDWGRGGGGGNRRDGGGKNKPKRRRDKTTGAPPMSQDRGGMYGGRSISAGGGYGIDDGDDDSIDEDDYIGAWPEYRSGGGRAASSLAVTVAGLVATYIWMKRLP